ncbi:MAG TPA: DnaJ domain-containing protein [Vicinamibacteria bacterium]|nr:DnaJ domain-containing protein [Vicinamibacteria bacterium]
MQTNEPLKGTLSEGALAPLLGGLQRTRASGWLRVSSMTLRSGIPSVTRFGLRLQGGRVVAVEADEDPLRPLPADLTERATIGITRLLAGRDAVQSWDPATETATLDPAAPLLAALALRAVDRVEAAVVEAALGDADRALVAGASAEAGHAPLTSSHRALLARIRPEVKAAELIRSGGEAAGRELLALLCAGVVEWAPAPTHAPPPQTDRPVAPPATARRPPTGSSAALRSLSAPASARPSAPAPAPAPPSAPPGQMRREIEEAHAALRGANHFAVLGLTVSASQDEVRQAFARLARRYHPDAQRDPALQDVPQKLNDIFVAIGNAYAVLKDAGARDRYERAMGLRLAAPRVTAARETAADPSTPARRADEPIEARLLRAEEALDAQQPWEAIRLLEETVSAAVGTLKVRAQVLLGRAYADRERPREAEKVLLEVLQADPVSVPACLLLGRIYRERGMVKRARGMFERALEIDAGRVDAQRELLALGADAEPPPPGGSLLSRLRDRH